MPLRDIVISPTLVLPARLLSATYSRSGGPGGQHVNKVATKVDLRLDLDGAREILGDTAVERIRERLETRLDSAGNLQVVANEHRERERNVEAALERLRALLVEALRVARPRRPTKPTRASRERRVAEKRRRGEVKKGRRPPGRDDDG